MALFFAFQHPLSRRDDMLSLTHSARVSLHVILLWATLILSALALSRIGWLQPSVGSRPRLAAAVAGDEHGYFSS